MNYVVRVVVTDEDTGSEDAWASAYFGPYRTRGKADAIAQSIMMHGCDYGTVCAFVERLEKATLAAIRLSVKRGLLRSR